MQIIFILSSPLPNLVSGFFPADPPGYSVRILCLSCRSYVLRPHVLLKL